MERMISPLTAGNKDALRPVWSELFLSFRFNLITLCVLFSVDSFRVIPSLFIVTHWHFCDPQYHSYLIIMLTLLLTSATILDLQPEYNLESLSTPCWWLELIILPRFSSSISWMFDVSVTYKYNTVYTFSYGAVQFEFTIGPPSLHHSIYLFIYPFNYVI